MRAHRASGACVMGHRPHRGRSDPSERAAVWQKLKERSVAAGKVECSVASLSRVGDCVLARSFLTSLPCDRSPERHMRSPIACHRFRPGSQDASLARVGENGPPWGAACAASRLPAAYCNARSAVGHRTCRAAPAESCVSSVTADTVRGPGTRGRAGTLEPALAGERRCAPRLSHSEPGWAPDASVLRTPNLRGGRAGPGANTRATPERPR
jgi:hypothetical protein